MAAGVLGHAGRTGVNGLPVGGEGLWPRPWYRHSMDGTYHLAMGDRGRLVVPVELRERLHLEPGTPMLLVETDDGLVLATREQARRLLRAQLGGQSLVEQLIADRRAAAAHGG